MEYPPLVDTDFQNLSVKLFYRLSTVLVTHPTILSSTAEEPIPPSSCKLWNIPLPSLYVFLSLWDVPLALINLATLVGQVSKVIPGRKTPIGGSY